MSFIPSFLRRPRAGLLIIFGSGALSGAAYRYSRTRSEFNASTLNPHTFAPFIIASKERVSSTSSIFTLLGHDTTVGDNVLRDVWKKSVWSAQVKQPQLQIARAYTPLPPSPYDDEEDYEKACQLRFLIRQEEGGEVSTFLHRLPEESIVELRGPNIEYQIPQSVKEVVFLAGGTGIAPAMQVAQALQDRPGTRMHILWANRRREDCEGGMSDSISNPALGRLSGWRSLFGLEEPMITGNNAATKEGIMVKELGALKRQAKRAGGCDLRIDYYVDEEKTFIKPATVSKLIQSASSTDAAQEASSRLILISGPDGFIEYWAGRKIWTAGREEQGPLGGALSKLNSRGWTVWKL
jgi:hypothetical protein